jgi:hypothetical protein
MVWIKYQTRYARLRLLEPVILGSCFLKIFTIRLYARIVFASALSAIAMPFADTAVVVGDLVFYPVVGEEVTD